MHRTLLITTLSLAFAVPLAAGAAEGDLAARQAAAKDAAQSLVKRLGAKLQEEMAAGGPGQAIGVCRDVAPQIAGELSRANGWRVTRVGTRVRNPMLGMPDAWEQEVLGKFQQRIAAGEKPADIAFGEVVSEPGGQYFRFMKAIPVQEACLNCHGDPAKLAEPVKAELQKHYPLDRAIGYSLGELRGAISIKQPLDIPLITATP